MASTNFDDKFFGRLENLSLYLQSTLSGYYGGKHLIKRYGQAMDFADFRRYELGDDIRSIDWNLFARFDKYFLKLFNDERQMHIRIFIDCSASMDVYPQKAGYALSLAAALGFLAVCGNDKVSFHLLKNGEIYDPFGLIVGKNTFLRAVGDLEKVDFDGEADFTAVSQIESVSSGDGLSIIISDLMTENDWHKAVDYLVWKKQQVLIMQVLAAEEIEPTFGGRFDLVDVEAAGERNLRLKIVRSMLDDYDDVFGEWLDEIRKFCLSRGATFVSADTRTPLEITVFRDLFSCDIIR